MALHVYTNQYSSLAQNGVTNANNALTKSIEKLSSGLRINHAADDASGLAISERLRDQIKGLSKASYNAQDAISLLQTAESGLEVINDMLHRMRELSVQASNSTYTANDRRELQKELDQLKNEINTVSASTEFNAKKLLNGSTSGLWASTSVDVDAILRGSPASGSYRLAFNVAPGKNAVYQSNILVNDNMLYNTETRIIGIDLDSAAFSGDTGAFDSLGIGEGYDAIYKISLDPDRYGTAVTTVHGYQTSGGTEPGVIKQYGVVAEGGYGQQIITTGSTIPNASNNANTQYSGFRGGYLALEFTENIDNTSIGADIHGLRAYYVDMYTGLESERIDITGAKFGQNFEIDLRETQVAGIFRKGTTTPDKIGVLLKLTLPAGNAGDKIMAGGKAIISCENGKTSNRSPIKVTVPGDGANGAVVQYEGRVTDFDKLNDSSNATPTYYGFTIIGGEFHKIAVTFGLAHNSWADLGGTTGVTIGLSGVNIITEDYYDFSVNNVLLKDMQIINNPAWHGVADETQTLTVYGNNRSVNIALEAKDTLKDLQYKLANAITDGLKMGAKNLQANDLVKFITAGNTADFGVAGTFIIQTGLLGKESELNFAGDEALLSVLGLSAVQNSRENETIVSISDADTGRFIGKDTISDGVLRGVIKSVDVKIKSTIGISASFNDKTNRVDFSARHINDIYLYVISNSADTQVGAKEGQKVDISLSRADTMSLRIDNAYILTTESAEKAITKFDEALQAVNKMRSTIGAQINRLEGTRKSISVTRQNMISSESAIRDLDIADESAAVIKNRILVDAATAVLAQANQIPLSALQLINK